MSSIARSIGSNDRLCHVGGAASDFMPADCDAALNNQQAALGDFIFAQRVAQDVCGR